MAQRQLSGQLFPIALPEGLEAVGRILLDLRAQCARPKLLLPSGPLFPFADAVLVEVSRGRGAGTGRLLPPMFCFRFDPGESAPGGGEVAPVDPADVDFPMGLRMMGRDASVTWGELSFPVPLTSREVHAAGVGPPIGDAGSLGAYALFALDRRDRLDPSFRDPEVFSASRLDLRASPLFERIRPMLGERLGPSYAATALRLGFDVARFRGPRERSREWLLCPCCRSPQADERGACSVCGADLTRDAPVSVTAEALGLLPRAPCGACRTPILKGAVRCPACKAELRS